MTRWLAACLRRLAERLDPPAPPPPTPRDEPGPELEFAQRMADEIELRRALHASLHRYSPTERPGEA